MNWIKTSEKTPEENGYYIVQWYNPEDAVSPPPRIERFYKGRWRTNSGHPLPKEDLKYLTHWMPLPEPPNEQ